MRTCVATFTLKSSTGSTVLICITWLWWGSPGAHSLRIIAGGKGYNLPTRGDRSRCRAVSERALISLRFMVQQSLQDRGCCVFPLLLWSTMRSSAWFVASCALILCTHRLIDGATGQRQCSEVRDAIIDQYRFFLFHFLIFYHRSFMLKWTIKKKTRTEWATVIVDSEKVIQSSNTIKNWWHISGLIYNMMP